MAKNRIKYAYKNRDEIQNAIDIGQLDAYDIIITKDTHEQFQVQEDLSYIPITSKIYTFPTIKDAENYIKTSSDKYNGQIISVLDGDIFHPYMINQIGDNYFINKNKLIFENEIDTKMDELDSTVVTQEDIDSLFGKEEEEIGNI
jgi:hypothetical protein